MSAQIVNFRPKDEGNWTQDAACDGLISAMFPSDGDMAGILVAKLLCLACPVRKTCLNEALDRREQYGIWGGLTPDERRNLSRKLSRAQAKEALGGVS